MVPNTNVEENASIFQRHDFDYLIGCNFVGGTKAMIHHSRALGACRQKLKGALIFKHLNPISKLAS
ncbi:Uncharacterized protein TCM_006092 isoform 2 [Theobroma cacao]|uniref:Uncharacterized protein isoform 2 n=1 Tax=Theobroma cacao TaxID=3641 RepID=A0A061DVX9_THECC|nr:Uncharacterized protein TCM_006092 isoform 2 [Theobroma cacao]